MAPKWFDHWTTWAGHQTPVNTMISDCVRCRQPRHVGSKTLLHQNPPVFNLGCQLMQIVLYYFGVGIIFADLLYFSMCMCIQYFAVSLLYIATNAFYNTSGNAVGLVGWRLTSLFSTNTDIKDESGNTNTFANTYVKINCHHITFKPRLHDTTC